MSRSVTELFVDSVDNWQQSVAYREREAEWAEQYRQVKVARSTALPFFILAPLCGFGFMVLPGVWSILSGVAGALLLVFAGVTFAGAPAFQRRLDELDREKEEGLLPSITQVYTVLRHLEPGPSVVHIFPDGRVVRFDQSGIHVANIQADRYEKHEVADVEIPDDGKEVVVHTADGNMIFPFRDEKTARAAAELLRETV
jgi:hypothetical protein